MANICCFRMSVKWDKSNISKFTSALTQDGEVWMGRGAEADIDFLSDSEAEIEGCCKWSIQSALIDDSFSMRRQKETGEGYWGDLDTSKGFISLFEACEEYHVNMEVYSEESGCGFSEHYSYNDGEILDECVNFSEECDEDTGEWTTSGGFPEWAFDVKMPA
jgi:hypothetical protein